MNFVLLQAEAGKAAGPLGGNSFLIMMVLIFVVMYFFMIRPQQKRQKALKQFRASLQKGSKVVTVGGIYGTVDEVKDAYIIVEVDNNVKLRFDRNSVLQEASDIPASK